MRLRTALTGALVTLALFTGCAAGGAQPEQSAGTEQAGSGEQAGSAEQAGSGEQVVAELAGDGVLQSGGEQAGTEAGAAIIVNHDMETDETTSFAALDGKHPLAKVSYPQIILSDRLKEAYPSLDTALADVNHEKKAYAYYQLSMKALYAQEYIPELPAYLVYESRYEIKRSDSKVFSFLDMEYDDMGGVHPNTVVKTAVIDPGTGKELETGDIFTDSSSLADLILGSLYPEADRSYEFTDESKREMLTMIREELRDGSIKWVADDSGISFYFSPYELNSYSLGVLRSDLSYEEHGDIIRQDYYPVGKEFAVSTYTDEDVVRLPITELSRYSEMDENNLELFSGLFERRSEAKPDLSGAIRVHNPGWDSFFAESSLKVETPEISKLSEDRTDWLDQDRWSDNTGIALPGSFPYTEGGYTFEKQGDEGWFLRVSAGASYGTPVNYEALGEAREKVFDFSEFMEPDSRTDSMFARFADMSIIHAAVFDDVLYVSIGHRTYASSQPHTAFIVAVSLKDGSFIWKSSDQISNSTNFLVSQDVIITGYGFTDEPDYMYILNRHTGEVISTTKLYTGPDYFIPMEDGTMYVLTYDTEYVFRVD